MSAVDQGDFLDRYSLIPRTLTFLTRERTVLLLKGAPTKKLWPNLFNGIGGHVERGEDIFTSALREIWEETGLKPINLWLCANITIDTGKNTGIGIYTFRGESPTGEPAKSAEGILEWISFDEIKGKPLVEDLSVLLPKILKMHHTDPPLSAHYSYDLNDKLVIKFGAV